MTERHPRPAHRRVRPVPARIAVAMAAAVVVLAACGSDDVADDDAETASTQVITEVPEDRVLAGVVRQPAPAVDGTTLPSLGDGDEEEIEFRAPPEGLQVVYFGFTNCPDVCPTTLFDLTVALRRLPDDVAGRVETVMVTVDPDRDIPVLADYVRSFVPDARAAGTSDDTRLAAAAAPFGASYDVVVADDGEIEVSHSGFLYAVDDRGELVVAWPFGTSSEEMAADIFQLLEEDA